MYVFELVGEDDDFASYEASAMVGDVDIVAPGIALGERLPESSDQLGWTRTILSFVARSRGDIEAMEDALESTTCERSGSIAVRARSLRDTTIDTLAIERALGRVLSECGCAVDLERPDHVLRVLVSNDVAVLGWVCIEPGGDVGRRRPTDRPFFQPGSMSPRLARWIVNVGGVRPGVRLLDPMCGTGGLVLEGVRVGGSCIGMDIQAKMARGTRANWRAVGEGSPSVLRGDAGRLPLRDDSVDVVVFDAPYGRQSKIAGRDIVEKALGEAERVGRSAVVVWDRPLEDLARAAGWSVEQTFERRVHRSLTRYICHLS